MPEQKETLFLGSSNGYYSFILCYHLECSSRLYILWDFHKSLGDKYVKREETEGKHSLTNTTKVYEVAPVTLSREKLFKKEGCAV